jgi:hypothetical protein
MPQAPFLKPSLIGTYMAREYVHWESNPTQNLDL